MAKRNEYVTNVDITLQNGEVLEKSLSGAMQGWTDKNRAPGRQGLNDLLANLESVFRVKRNDNRYDNESWENMSGLTRMPVTFERQDEGEFTINVSYEGGTGKYRTIRFNIRTIMNSLDDAGVARLISRICKVIPESIE